MESRRQWVLVGALLILVVVFLAMQVLGSGPRIGAPAADFTGTTVDGRSLRLADLRGRNAVLLNFFSLR